MADYDGEFVPILASHKYLPSHFSAGGMPSGWSELVEFDSKTCLRIRAGGQAFVYAGLDVEQSVIAPVYPLQYGRATMKLFRRGGGEPLDVVRSVGTDDWEDLVVTLPSGFPKDIYVIGLFNFAAPANTDKGPLRDVYFGKIEVV